MGDSDDEIRKREIAQGLRTPQGTLIGGLNAEEYGNGIHDFEAGRPPPDVTTTSYDLGRARASRQAERLADVRREIHRKMDDEIRRTREIIGSLPEALAQFDAAMATLDERVARVGRKDAPNPAGRSRRKASQPPLRRT